MSHTHQLRLSDQDQIRKRIREFLGKKINIVLNDNRVIAGEIADVLDTGVTVKNMRLKTNHFSFHEINEIYSDTLT